MSKKFSFPSWVPKVHSEFKILIVGASGGIGQAVIRLLLQGPECFIGAHRATSKSYPYKSYKKHHIIDIQSELKTDADCRNFVDTFVDSTGSIDALVVLCGGISKSTHWKNLTENQWNDDIQLNLNIPFFLARRSMELMKNNGGRIVLIGTESAIHGGNPTSLPYGIAKRGIECLVQGLAREGAKDNILVNGVRPGFIGSGFHERWQGKTEEDLKKRVTYIPLKRVGEPEEVAALIIYLMSGWAQFITGQMFAITGGDWL